MNDSNGTYNRKINKPCFKNNGCMPKKRKTRSVELILKCKNHCVNYNFQFLYFTKIKHICDAQIGNNWIRKRSNNFYKNTEFAQF